MTTPIDPRAEPPEQPKTLELDAVQVLSQLIKGVSAEVKASREETTASFVKVDDRLTSQDRKLDKVVTEGIEANVRMTRFENRLEVLEKSPSTPPLNSTGVKALIDGHPSQVTLETQAKLAEAIIEQAKLRDAIHETRAKVELQPSKEDLKKANELQAEAIVGAVLKTPTMQKLKNALVPVLMVAISIIGLKLTMILSKLEEKQPVPATPVVLLAPVYVDAGGDR